MAPDGLPHRSEVNMKRFSSSRGFLLTLGAIGLLALRAHSASAQAATITGTIKSESGQPVENANAYIQELNISVATNTQGRYSIVIPAERVRGQSVVLR